MVEALRGASLQVGKGDFIAVIGASGSGRSTLLHDTAGLPRTDGGRVLVEGQDLSKMSYRKLTARDGGTWASFASRGSPAAASFDLSWPRRS